MIAMTRLFYALPYGSTNSNIWDFKLYVISAEPNAAGMTQCWDVLLDAWAAFEDLVYWYPSRKLSFDTAKLAERFAQDLCKVIADLWAWRLRDSIDHTQLWRDAPRDSLLNFPNYRPAVGMRPEYYSVELVLAADTFFQSADMPWKDRVHDAVKRVVAALVEVDERVLHQLEHADPRHVYPRLKIISSPLVVHPEMKPPPEPALGCSDLMSNEHERRVLHFYQRQSITNPLRDLLEEPDRKGT